MHHRLHLEPPRQEGTARPGEQRQSARRRHEALELATQVFLSWPWHTPLNYAQEWLRQVATAEIRRALGFRAPRLTG